MFFHTFAIFVHFFVSFVCHVECLKGGGAKVHWKKCGSRTGCKYVKKVGRFRGRFLGTEMRHLERKKDAEQNPIPRYPTILNFVRTYDIFLLYLLRGFFLFWQRDSAQ
jgi:hypothetical protein